MKEYEEENYLMLSGIQHFSFCRRQWALLHIEQQWAENVRTIEGNLLHEKVHNSFSKDKRRTIIISRGMPIFSKELGVSGECDVVEFQESAMGIPIAGRNGKYEISPIEYKRGSPKETDEDVFQLVAQAMCLEEMFCCQISKGYLYYWQTKRREPVEITVELREKVQRLFFEMHRMYERKHTPKVKTGNHCKACSIKEICLPVLCKNKSAKEYIKNRIAKDE